MKLNNVEIPSELTEKLFFHVNNYTTFRNTKWFMTDAEYEDYVNNQVSELNERIVTLITEQVPYKEAHYNGTCDCLDSDEEDYIECEYKKLERKIKDTVRRIEHTKAKTKKEYIAEIEADLFSKIEVAQTVINQYSIEQHLALRKKLTATIYNPNGLALGEMEVELTCRTTAIAVNSIYELGKVTPVVIPGKRSTTYTGLLNNQGPVQVIPWKNGLMITSSINETTHIAEAVYLNNNS